MDSDRIIRLFDDFDNQDTRTAFVNVLMPVIRGIELYVKYNYTERHTWKQTISNDMLAEVLNNRLFSIKVCK